MGSNGKTKNKKCNKIKQKDCGTTFKFNKNVDGVFKGTPQDFCQKTCNPTLCTPSSAPSSSHSDKPPESPSSNPSASPSSASSTSPSENPSASSSVSPSVSPSKSRSPNYSASPSKSLSASPSAAPSASPSAGPSASQSESPSAPPEVTCEDNSTVQFTFFSRYGNKKYKKCNQIKETDCGTKYKLKEKVDGVKKGKPQDFCQKTCNFIFCLYNRN